MSRTIQSELKKHQQIQLLSVVARGKVFNLLRAVLLCLALVSLGCILYATGMLYTQTGVVSIMHGLQYSHFWSGIGFIATAAFIKLRVCSFYFNSYYFKGVASVYISNEEEGLSYEAADICLKGKNDLAYGLLTHSLGKKFARRAGLTPEAVATYLSSERPKLDADAISLEGGMFTFSDLVLFIVEHDESFKKLLQENGVTEENWKGALQWTYLEFATRKQQERWWSLDVLSTKRSIGREFSYGTPYLLERYTKSIRSTAVLSLPASVRSYGSEYIAQIESILARKNEANVLLVGEAGVGKIDILMEVGYRMDAGKALGAVVGKHLMVLDTNRLLADLGQKTELEQTLIRLFSQAAGAGNVILVIDKLDEFLQSGASLGVDIASLLDSYLNSPELHVVGTIETAVYHRDIETKGGFLRRFETVLIEATDIAKTIQVLLLLVTHKEQHSHFTFTYESVAQIAEDADRYIVNGVMPDKAVHLLDEVVTHARSSRTALIDKQFVDDYVSKKVGMPIGALSGSEKDVLLNLEEVLHKRIVGQERAIASISGVMRRSRAGIQDESKPIGSLLFLGPTGVGKTESAKALAEVFFGSEDAMHRINMPEFNGFDAIDKLIGTRGQTGVLSNMLKEHAYCVLLLDEFEKADPKVHDLFLSILDEGTFVDGLDQKINARNTIIIATSNAGSRMILDWVDRGESLENKEDEIVHHIIAESLFKPELINRFDGVVIFEPLNTQEQAAIAKAMLGSLQERIEEKGYTLDISDELVQALVKIGYQPEFGARPMQRAIQDFVEEAVAKKILEGNLKKGSVISLTADEIASFKADR